MISKTSALLASLVFSATAAHAVVTITTEAPGVENTTLPISSAVETFDAAPLGLTTNFVTTFGDSGTTATIDTVRINDANQYGAAGGTGHYAGINSGSSTTISLTGAPVDVFGLWVSALDRGNSIAIYNGATLLFSASLYTLPLGPGNYSGNPDAPFAGQNTGERYAFFNFAVGQAFDRIVLSEAQSSGVLEVDNFTIGLSDAVPEPASWALLITGFAMVGYSMRRRSTWLSA